MKRGEEENHRGQRGFACEPCARRKVRCCRASPCRNCLRRGEHCVYAVPSDEFAKRHQRHEELKRKRLRSADGASPLHEQLLSAAEQKRLSPSPGPVSLLFGTARADEDFEGDLPAPAQRRALLRIFKEHVHPVVTLLPAWKLDEILQRSMDNPRAVPPSIHALHFAMFTLALWTMSDGECEALLRARRGALIERYQACTERALCAAQLLQNNDILVLHAFHIYLVAISDRLDTTITWTLMGVLIRMAERHNLHQDPAARGMSGWDTEYRRRLWSEIKKLNRRLSEFCGAGTAALQLDGNTKSPAGMDDHLMRPGMPVANAGDFVANDCLLTMVREELTMWEEVTLTSLFKNPGVRWLNRIRDPNIPLAKKEVIIDDLEARLQNKYFAFCDPLKASHYMAGIVGRGAVTVARLCAYYFHGKLGNALPGPEGDKQDPALYAQRALQYHLLSMTTPLIAPFKWHCKYQFQWHALFVLLLEMRNRPRGPQVESRWKLIADIFDSHPEMTFHIRRPVHAAAGDLLLRAWDACKAHNPAGVFHGPEPAFIKSVGQARQLYSELAPLGAGSTEQHGPYSTLIPSNGTADARIPSAMDSFDQSTAFSVTDLAPLEWNMWDNIPFEDFDWEGFDMLPPTNLQPG